jgi:hypothetical protein
VDKEAKEEKTKLTDEKRKENQKKISQEEDEVSFFRHRA